MPFPLEILAALALVGLTSVIARLFLPRLSRFFTPIIVGGILTAIIAADPRSNHTPIYFIAGLAWGTLSLCFKRSPISVGPPPRHSGQATPGSPSRAKARPRPQPTASAQAGPSPTSASASPWWATVLEVAPDAPWDEIRRAYRRQASDYHPDKAASLPTGYQRFAEERMKSINAAYRAARAARRPAPPG